MKATLERVQRSSQSEWSRATQALGQSFLDSGSELLISGPQIGSLAHTPSPLERGIDVGERKVYERVYIDWRSRSVRAHVQTLTAIERRNYLVSIRNAPDWKSLLSWTFAFYAICLIAIFLIAQACLLLIIVARLRSPIRSLTLALEETNRLDSGNSLATSAGVADPDVVALTKQLRYVLNSREIALSTQRALLRDLSHELRTPLTALRSVGELALSRIHDVTASRDALHSILEEAAHMQSLMEGLLTLARASEIVPPEKTELVDCAALVEDCVSSMIPVAEERLQKLHVMPSSGVRFIGSYLIARQALMNLILNAINHCAAGCTIAVSVSAPENDRQVHLTVSDDGPGIDEGEHELIFQRFRRGNRTQRHVEGHGLGLAIAKAFVNAQGGMLTLRSKLGEGAHFTMSYRRHRE